MGCRVPVAATIVALAFLGLATAAQAADWNVPAAADGRDFLSHRVDGPSTRFVPVADPAPDVVPADVTNRKAWAAVPCGPPCAPRRAPACAPRTCWEVRVGLAGWLPGMTGPLTLAGQESDVDFNWTDWFDNLDKIEFAIELFGSVRYQNWRFSAGWLTMVLGDSVPLPDPTGAALDAELTINIVRATVGYDVWRVPLSCTSCYPCFTLNLLAGVRYYHMGLELTARVPGAAPVSVDRDREWADPLIGTHLLLDLSPCWSTFLKADVGGFGVGSDLSWSVGVGVEWRFWKHLALQGGWNILDVDYATGSGTNRFVFDQNMSGPFINLVAFF